LKAGKSALFAQLLRCVFPPAYGQNDEKNLHPIMICYRPLFSNVSMSILSSYLKSSIANYWAKGRHSRFRLHKNRRWA